MPEPHAKRQRKGVKERKAAAREGRRIARGASVMGAHQIKCDRGFGTQFATSGSLDRQ
jgi:hypothetical protein